jgi:hypothetical protein
MKKLTLIFTLIIGLSFTAFGQAKYKMFQLAYLKPLPDTDMKAAKEAMMAHNETYHQEGPYQASIWSNLTGEMTGTWAWVMGPVTFTDFDNRPGDPDHDADWNKVVQGNFKLVANEYWRMDEELSYAPEGYELGDKVVWTVYDLKPGDGYRFKEMVTKIIEVYKEKKYAYDFTVYWNQFDNTDGRDVVTEGSFTNWAFLDRERDFKKDFEEVHGEGSWWKLIEEYRDIVASSYDELSVKLD